MDEHYGLTRGAELPKSCQSIRMARFRTYYAMSTILLFLQLSPQMSTWEWWKRYYETKGLSQIMEYCDLGRSYNKENGASFWNEKRVYSSKKYWMQQGFSASATTWIMSAQTGVMKKVCPDVW